MIESLAMVGLLGEAASVTTYAPLKGAPLVLVILIFTGLPLEPATTEGRNFPISGPTVTAPVVEPPTLNWIVPTVADARALPLASLTALLPLEVEVTV